MAKVLRERGILAEIELEKYIIILIATTVYGIWSSFQKLKNIGILPAYLTVHVMKL
jgi:hypothetical protein